MINWINVEDFMSTVKRFNLERVCIPSRLSVNKRRGEWSPSKSIGLAVSFLFSGHARLRLASRASFISF